MTDAEIIKALECCSVGTFACDEQCPCFHSKSNLKLTSCRFELIGDALDLINRQKAEIENCVDALCKKEDMMQLIAEERQQYYDELQISKAEIERLQSILLKFVREINNFENKHNIDTSDFSLIPILEEEKNNLVKQIKAEAIKEFAERLKENTIEVDVSYGYGREHYTEAVAVIEIDNIAKKMAGDAK